MAIQRTSRAFKDISFSFSPHPVTKDLPVLLNERAIVRSVRNLVETIPTERFFNSLLGTDIREDQVRESIRNFEPRVGEIDIEVEARPDDNELQVKVLFEIQGLEVPTQSFTFILEPTR